MTCVDPEIGKHLLSYALHRIDTGSAREFEAHLLQCDECFEDLKALDRTKSVLSRYVREHPEYVAIGAASLRRRRTARLTIVSAAMLIAVAGGALLCGVCIPSRSSGAVDAARNGRRTAVAPASTAALAREAKQALDRSEDERASRLLDRASRSVGSDLEDLGSVLLVDADLHLSQGLPALAIEDLDRAANAGLAANDSNLYVLSEIGKARILLFRQLHAAAGREEIAKARRALGRHTPPPRVVVELTRLELRRCTLVDDDYRQAKGIVGCVAAFHEKAPGDRLLRKAILEEDALLAEASYAAHPTDGESLTRAKRLYESLARLCREGGDDVTLLRALAGLGRVAILSGDPGLAEKELRSALEAGGSSRSGDALRARANLALAELQSKRPSKAEETLKPLLSAPHLDTHPFLAADAAGLEGSILSSLKKSGAAKKRFETALSRSEKLYPTRLRKRRTEALKRRLAGGRPEKTTHPLPISSGIY